MPKNRLPIRKPITTLLLLALAVPAQTPSAAQQTPPKQPAATASTPAPIPDDTNIGVDSMNGKYIKIWRSIMAPKNVADTFGHRIATKYIAVQVTIANRNRDYQWLIQDAAVDVNRLVKDLARKEKCEPNMKLLLTSLQNELQRDPGKAGEHMRVTSADLTILRGVAEKGQSLDPRNMTVRSFTAAGVIAAGMIGVTRVGHSYAPGVAAFNGPLLSALQEIWPDYTVNQLNRLNDSAFLTNTVVGKQQAKVIVLFIPQSDLLTSAQQKKYYSDPESIYACPDLRMLEASADGNFIANIDGSPMATAVTIDSSEVAKFQTDNFTVNGTITGNFLAGTTVDLVSPPEGLKITTGAVTDTSIKFTLTDVTPLMPGTVLDLVIKPKTSTDPVVHVGYKADYIAPKPAIAASNAAATVAPGGNTTIKLTGAHFLPEGMKVRIDPADKAITVGAIKFVSTTEIDFDVAATAAATTGKRSLFVSNSASGESNSALAVNVNP